MSGTDQTPSTTRRNVLIVVGVVVLGAVAAAVWWFTRPEAATVDISNALGASTASPATGAEPSTAAASPTPAATDPATPSGTASPSAPSADDPTGEADGGGEVWTVTTDAVEYDFDTAAGTFVGFRIDEELNQIGATTAVGRTPAVEGEFSLDDTTISDGSFTADLSEMSSDRGQRQRAMMGALRTSEFPEATFELTEEVSFDEVPPVGEVIEVTVTGDLTIAGETNQVEIPLEAAFAEEGLLVVTGSFEVTLADYGIDAPSAPIVVSVADVATVELQLYLRAPA